MSRCMLRPVLQHHVPENRRCDTGHASASAGASQQVMVLGRAESDGLGSGRDMSLHFQRYRSKNRQFRSLEQYFCWQTARFKPRR